MKKFFKILKKVFDETVKIKKLIVDWRTTNKKEKINVHIFNIKLALKELSLYERFLVSFLGFIITGLLVILDFSIGVGIIAVIISTIRYIISFFW